MGACGGWGLARPEMAQRGIGGSHEGFREDTWLKLSARTRPEGRRRALIGGPLWGRLRARRLDGRGSDEFGGVQRLRGSCSSRKYLCKSTT